MRAYLSGAIEYAPDHGRDWRAAITPFLESLGHQVYDPALDVKKNLTDEEVADFRSWKHTDLARFQATVRKIIDYDLEWIAERTDFIVSWWDEYAQRGAGTQAELTFAYRLNIPVYLITSVDVTEISGWILACSTAVFPTVEEFERELPRRLPLASAAMGH
jgi:nucleoside 2-deoxyribosyltransferase